MINEVALEGIVVREPWKFMDDLFFRLVIYRDSDLPAKKLDLERDAGDYWNGLKQWTHLMSRLQFEFYRT